MPQMRAVKESCNPCRFEAWEARMQADTSKFRKIATDAKLDLE
jgi:hypothetical protein